MKVGVHVLNYTWPGGPHRLAQDLTRVAQAAEDNGFDKLSVMDHLWQHTSPHIDRSGAVLTAVGQHPPIGPGQADRAPARSLAGAADLR